MAHAHALSVPATIQAVEASRELDCEWRVTFVRDEQGDFSRLYAHWFPGGRDRQDGQRNALLQHLDLLTPRELTELIITHEPGMRWVRPDLKRLYELAQRRTRLTRLQLPSP